MSATVTKRPYANDGSLESVEDMLIKQAGLFYARVLGMGLPMEFEDVLQELRMAYVKARAKWNPEKAKFNTYCFTVARNEFNRRIERMALDRQHLGLGSIDDLASSDGEDTGDGYERYLNRQDEAEEGAESRLEYRQNMMQNVARLSPHTRAVVKTLLANEVSTNGRTMTLREIAVHLGLAIPQMQAVQKEIADVFGVHVVITKALPRIA